MNSSPGDSRECGAIPVPRVLFVVSRHIDEVFAINDARNVSVSMRRQVSDHNLAYGLLTRIDTVRNNCLLAKWTYVSHKLTGHLKNEVFDCDST